MIVLTGATGHIGNVLVRELLARGEELRLIIPQFEDTTAIDGLKIEKFEGDVRDIASLIRAFDGAKVVYHLAGIVSIMGKSDLIYQVNVAGTHNVVEACLKSAVERLVYTSSIHAIEEPPHGTVIDETFPFDPDKVAGDYAKSKALATLEVQQGVKEGLDAVIVCPTGVIGPFDFKPSEMGQLFIDFARNKVKAGIEGGYDFVDVRDVVTGHVLACEKGRTGEAYILSGEWISVADIMATLAEVTGIKAPHSRAPIWLARIGAIFSPIYYRLTNTKPIFTDYSLRTLASNAVVSRAKAESELTYYPRPIKESITDAVQWFRETGRL